MRTKCRSIATFHRPIHSHWSLPLNTVCKCLFYLLFSLGINCFATFNGSQIRTEFNWIVLLKFLLLSFEAKPTHNNGKLLIYMCVSNIIHNGIHLYVFAKNTFCCKKNAHSWKLLFLGESVWDRERGRHTEQSAGDAIRWETAQVGIGGHH